MNSFRNILLIFCICTVASFLIQPSPRINSERLNRVQRARYSSNIQMTSYEDFPNFKKSMVSRVFASLLIWGSAVGGMGTIQSVHALDQQYKLPPIDRKDTNRCQLVSSSIGQANAARDKLYDLRECDLRGQSGAGKDLSGKFDKRRPIESQYHLI